MRSTRGMNVKRGFLELDNPKRVDNYLKTTKDSRMIVSNYGILGEILPNKQFSVTYPYWDEAFPSYAHFCRKYGMAPVCLIERKEIYGKDIFVFANASESKVFDSTLDKEIEINNIAIGLGVMSATYIATFYLGALRHHLCSIIKAYLETASDFSKLRIPADWKLQDKDSLLPDSKLPIKWIQNLPVSKVGAMMLGSSSVEAIFYEMMAYLTSARSLLDSLVSILRYRPSIYQSGRHISERSYSVFMNRIEKYKLPIQLKEYLMENLAWASKLTHYRDCLLHYVPLSRSPLPSVMVIHTENRIVALLVWLPDNPETRSMKNFRFDTHIDYLGYAHATYLKLLDLCFNVLKDTYSEVRDT